MTGLVETPDMAITLADGCRLSARVWMPENAAAAPVPAILEYLPYRKRDGTVAHVAICRQGWADLNRWMVRRGWAIAYSRYSTDYIAAENNAQQAGFINGFRDDASRVPERGQVR